VGFEETNPSRFYTSFIESRDEVSSGIELSTPNYLELIGDTVSAMAPTDLRTLDPNAVAAVQLRVNSPLAKLNFTTSAMPKKCRLILSDGHEVTIANHIAFDAAAHREYCQLE